MGLAVRQLSIQAVAAVVWATVPPPDRPPGFCLSSNDVHRLVSIRPLVPVSLLSGGRVVSSAPWPALSSVSSQLTSEAGTVGPPGSLLPLGEGAN